MCYLPDNQTSFINRVMKSIDFCWSDDFLSVTDEGNAYCEELEPKSMVSILFKDEFVF